MFEKPKSNKKEIPTGTGRESEPKEILPAVEVQNEVMWVNKDFPELPFDIKEGESTKLGLFLTPKPKEGEKTFDLKASGGHYRSGLLGRVIFKDKEGRFYRDVDLKGMGRVFSRDSSGLEFEVGEVTRRHGGEKGQASGILDLEWAKHSRDMSEKFLEKGIRTERYIALIEPKEIIDSQGQKISIAKAKKVGILPERLQPAIALRAFATKFRVYDIQDIRSYKTSDFIKKLEDARKIVSQELGINEKNFSFKKYFKWFAKTLGENIGKMHNNGWFHNYLTEHNITLDCRIVDLDSVEKFTNRKERAAKNKIMEDDFSDGKKVLYILEYVMNALRVKWEDHEEIFRKAYEEALGYIPKFLKKHA